MSRPSEPVTVEIPVGLLRRAAFMLENWAGYGRTRTKLPGTTESTYDIVQELFDVLNAQAIPSVDQECPPDSGSPLLTGTPPEQACACTQSSQLQSQSSPEDVPADPFERDPDASPWYGLGPATLQWKAQRAQDREAARQGQRHTLPRRERNTSSDHADHACDAAYPEEES